MRLCFMVQAEGLEAILQTERKAAKARDARQKLEVDRLTRKVADLQVCPQSE